MKKRSNLLKSQKAQLTIFIIIALVIVGVLIILLLPTFKRAFMGPDPDAELKSCLKENAQPALEAALLHGGSIKPTLYYMYGGETIDYVCYTNEYYKTCIMQKPLLKQMIEAEIEKEMQSAVNKCVEKVKKGLGSTDFTIETAGTGNVDVKIIPDHVIITLDWKLTTEKAGVQKVYEKFNGDFSSGAYDLIMIASSISNWEARFGDAVPEAYMSYYPNTKVEKKIQPDETTIYILTDRTTKEKFTFASRSLAWPPGYAA